MTHQISDSIVKEFNPGLLQSEFGRGFVNRNIFKGQYYGRAYFLISENFRLCCVELYSANVHDYEHTDVEYHFNCIHKLSKEDCQILSDLLIDDFMDKIQNDS